MNMKKIKPGFLILFLIPVLLFSFTPGNENPVKIALSKSSPNYVDWIHRGDSGIVIIDLAGMKPADAIQRLHDCSGLILTGGGDIDPSMYQSEGNKEECKDIDRNRDILETALIHEALSLKMPILGICRGEQMLNVVLGGSLITDIQSYMKLKSQVRNSSPVYLTGPETAVIASPEPVKNVNTDVIHECDDFLHCFHPVRLEPTSLLRSIIGSDTGTVTTNHHQAILKLGSGLKKNAQSADSIIEGIEWKDAVGKSFMLGVQWHPERMDASNAFSGKLLQRFLAETQKSALNTEKVK
jgi:putative glutamine amidotransferase